MFVLTEGGGEGPAGVPVHFRGRSRCVQGSQGLHGDVRSADQAQHVPPNSGLGLCPPPAGLKL